MKTNTSCMNLMLYYDVRRHYNRYNEFSHLRKLAGSSTFSTPANEDSVPDIENYIKNSYHIN